jgi:hypothetical protein
LYQTFLKRNGVDLKNMKFNSLMQLNFEKHDEFVEYETFLNNSYFSELITFLKDLKSIGQNISKDEWTSSYVEATSKEEHKSEEKKYNFTQDLQVYSNKFERIPH